MLWDKRFDNNDEVPSELRGKTPAEVAAALKKLQEDAVKAEEIRVAREAADQKAVQLQADLDAERAKVAELSKPPIVPPVDDGPPSPWTDPEKFVDDRMKGLTNVALNSGMMTAKMYFQQNIDPRDSKIFRKYEKEVEQVIGTFAVEQRVMPQSWLNAFLYVKGLHERDIQKAETTNTDFFAETPSRGAHQEEPPPSDTLTDEEKAVCKSMHWSEEGYLKRKKEMTLAASSKGSYARFTAPTTTNR